MITQQLVCSGRFDRLLRHLHASSYQKDCHVGRGALVVTKEVLLEVRGVLEDLKVQNLPLVL